MTLRKLLRLRCECEVYSLSLTEHLALELWREQGHEEAVDEMIRNQEATPTNTNTHTHTHTHTRS